MLAKRFFYVCAGLLCLAFAYHLGARGATAQSPAGEVAVAMGTAADNDPLPLPTYRDGTTALLSECRWIVSPGYVNATRFGATVHRCETFNTGVEPLMYWLEPNDSNDPSRANYLVIAVRGSGATPATRETWGGLKARYRPGVSATPQDR